MIHFDARWLTLSLMVLSAAIVIAAGWFILSVFLSIEHYIPSALL